MSTPRREAKYQIAFTQFYLRKETPPHALWGFELLLSNLSPLGLWPSGWLMGLLIKDNLLKDFGYLAKQIDSESFVQIGRQE